MGKLILIYVSTLTVFIGILFQSSMCQKDDVNGIGGESNLTNSNINVTSDNKTECTNSSSDGNDTLSDDTQATHNFTSAIVLVNATDDSSLGNTTDSIDDNSTISFDDNSTISFDDNSMTPVDDNSTVSSDDTSNVTLSNNGKHSLNSTGLETFDTSDDRISLNNTLDDVVNIDDLVDDKNRTNNMTVSELGNMTSTDISTDDNKTEVFSNDDKNETIGQPFITSNKFPNIDDVPLPPVDKGGPPVKPFDTIPDSPKTTFTDIGDGGFTDVGTNFDDGFSDLFAGDDLGGDTGFYDGDLCIEPPCDPLPTTPGLPTVPPTPAPPPPPPPPPPPKDFFESLVPEFMPIPDNVPKVPKRLHDQQRITENLKRRIESLRGQFDAFKTKPVESKTSSGLNFFNPFALFSEVTGRASHRNQHRPTLHPSKHNNNQRNIFPDSSSTTPEFSRPIDPTIRNRNQIPDSPNNPEFQGFGMSLEKASEKTTTSPVSQPGRRITKASALEKSNQQIPTRTFPNTKEKAVINPSDWPYKPQDPATRSRLDNLIIPERNTKPPNSSRQTVQSLLDKALTNSEPVSGQVSANTDEKAQFQRNGNNPRQQPKKRRFIPGIPAQSNSDLSAAIFGSPSFPDSNSGFQTPNTDRTVLDEVFGISSGFGGSSLPNTRQQTNVPPSPLELFGRNVDRKSSGPTIGFGESIPITRNNVNQNIPFTGLESTSLFDPKASSVGSGSSVPVEVAKVNPAFKQTSNNVNANRGTEPVNRSPFVSGSPFKPGVPSFRSSPSLFDDILFNRKPADKTNNIALSSNLNNANPNQDSARFGNINSDIGFSTRSRETRNEATDMMDADQSKARPAFKQNSNQMSIRKPGIPMWDSNNFHNTNFRLFNSPVRNKQTLNFGDRRQTKSDPIVFSNDFGLNIVENKSPLNSVQDTPVFGNTQLDSQSSANKLSTSNSAPVKPHDSLSNTNQDFDSSQPIFGSIFTKPTKDSSMDSNQPTFGSTFPKPTKDSSSLDSNQPMFGDAFPKPTKISSLDSNQPTFGSTFSNPTKDSNFDSNQSMFGQSQNILPHQSETFGSSFIPPTPKPLVPPPTDLSSFIDLPPPPPSNMKVDQAGMLGALFGGPSANEIGVTTKRSTDTNTNSKVPDNQNQAFHIDLKTINDNLQNPPVESGPELKKFASNADATNPLPPTPISSVTESPTKQPSIMRPTNNVKPSFKTPLVSSAVRRELANAAEMCRNCHFVNGYCYVEEPGNCARFVECSQQGREVRAFEKECPYNLFWHQGNLTCQISYDVHCKTDPCRDLSVINHPYIGKCRAYWTCKKGASHARCCPKGYGYGERLGKMECVPMAGCNDECVSTTPDNQIKHECFLAKDPATPFRYIDINLQTSLPCAPGTRFDDKECTCIQSQIDSAPLPQACAKDLFLDFEGGQYEKFKDKSGKGSTIEAVNVVAGSAAGRTAATFNKNGRIKLWKYANLKIGPAIAIQFKFFPFRGTSRMKTLLSNCNKQNQMASIEIELDTWYSNVIFKIETSGKPHNRINEIKIKYKPFHWNHAALLYTEGSFAAAVGDNSEFKFLEGQIPNRHPAIVIGGCSKTSPDGYIGYMDDISIYNGCIPMELESKYLFR